MRLAYTEIENKLDVKYIPTLFTGYTFPTSIYEINDIDLMIKSSLPDEVKVKVTTDDFRLRSNSTINKRNRSSKKSFFFEKNIRIY